MSHTATNAEIKTLHNSGEEWIGKAADRLPESTLKLYYIFKRLITKALSYLNLVPCTNKFTISAIIQKEISKFIL